MPVPLPYPKAPEVPLRPTSLTRGLPKFKRLFNAGPAPIQSPPNFAVRVPPRRPGRDVGPMSPRGSYIRFLKEENVHSPNSLAEQLLQVLQGGGAPLTHGRADVLKLIARAWLGG